MIRYGSRYISLMGVLNLTPDSFEESSRVTFRGEVPSVDDCLRRTERILGEGADIIDFGACSTRPGSTAAELECEWRRLGECLAPLRREFGDELKISIDTFRAEIVRRAYLECGRFLVNDVSGAADPDMLPLVGGLALEYVATHCGASDGDVTGKTGCRVAGAGDIPDNNGDVTGETWCRVEGAGDIPDNNGDVTGKVLAWMRGIGARLEEVGLNEGWYADPGLGFGKDFAQNWTLMEHLSDFQALGRPILVGWSDKRMVRDSSGKVSSELEERALELSLRGGVSVIRTHSVERIMKMIKFAL
ncbi:MAG: dihydropteroate synthase [Bacteroidales bacterium]|nr:dihydropteroate synthase [Bacteroidales bacterium]